ncbi:hypothetical protein XELAEV_18042133mg [Xenopus laevis]|uniref:Uncharacterized protein n=1 Tax=Xenopus laevis TaxID=8355 RepID=A0A974H5Q9_XENLA|nr:hypothetical protein XELAEV_18042133mg [Xenopus laevis]
MNLLLIPWSDLFTIISCCSSNYTIIYLLYSCKIVHSFPYALFLEGGTAVSELFCFKLACIIISQDLNVGFHFRYKATGLFS